MRRPHSAPTLHAGHWADGLDAPESTAAWLRVPADGSPVRGVLGGPPRTWWAHFVCIRGRTYGARCLAREGVPCALCERGNQARARYVLPVWCGGVLHYLELGRTQYPDLMRIGATGGWPGRLVEVRRMRPGRQAPIRIQATGIAELPGEPLDIAEMVRGLGRRELVVVLRLLSLDGGLPNLGQGKGPAHTQSVWYQDKGKGMGKGQAYGVATARNGASEDE